MGNDAQGFVLTPVTLKMFCVTKHLIQFYGTVLLGNSLAVVTFVNYSVTEISMKLYARSNLTLTLISLITEVCTASV